MLKYKKNGLYVGKNDNDVFVFRINGIEEDMPFLKYHYYLRNLEIIAQPINGNLSPLQRLKLSFFDETYNVELLENPIAPEDADREGWDMFLSWSINWGPIYDAWRQLSKGSGAYDYVCTFRECVLNQWDDWKVGRYG